MCSSGEVESRREDDEEKCLACSVESCLLLLQLSCLIAPLVLINTNGERCTRGERGTNKRKKQHKVEVQRNDRSVKDQRDVGTDDAS